MKTNSLFDLDSIPTKADLPPKAVTLYYVYVDDETGRFVAAQPKTDHWNPYRGFYLHLQPKRKPRLWKSLPAARKFAHQMMKEGKVGVWFNG